MKTGVRCVTLGALLWASQVWAGGFAVSEHDAAATGRAGAALARTGSPSAVHYNPAGLSQVEGVAASGGLTALMPSASAIDPLTGTVDYSQPGVRTPPHVYAAYGQGKVSGGVGFNAPFGGGLRWAEDWRGRFELVELQLQVLGLHVAAAYRLTDTLSVGVTGSLYRASVLLDRRADFVDSEGSALLGGSGFAFGAAFGATWAASETLRFGLVGRLPASATLSGRAHFQGVPLAYSNVLPDQAIQSRLTLPGKVGLGAELDVAPLRLFAESELTFWSSFQSFDIDFEQAQTPDVSQPRDWAPAATFRLGAELHAAWLGPEGRVRGGALFDMAASPSATLSPSLPDSHRVGLSLGLGRRFGPVRVDAAYAFIAFLPRESSGDAFAASYRARAHLVALTLGYAR